MRYSTTGQNLCVKFKTKARKSPMNFAMSWRLNLACKSKSTTRKKNKNWIKCCMSTTWTMHWKHLRKKFKPWSPWATKINIWSSWWSWVWRNLRIYMTCCILDWRQFWPKSWRKGGKTVCWSQWICSRRVKRIRRKNCRKSGSKCNRKLRSRKKKKTAKTNWFKTEFKILCHSVRPQCKNGKRSTKT